jgi:hypothetical protein
MPRSDLKKKVKTLQNLRRVTIPAASASSSWVCAWRRSRCCTGRTWRLREGKPLHPDEMDAMHAACNGMWYTACGISVSDSQLAMQCCMAMLAGQQPCATASASLSLILRAHWHNTNVRYYVT